MQRAANAAGAGKPTTKHPSHDTAQQDTHRGEAPVAPRKSHHRSTHSGVVEPPALAKGPHNLLIASLACARKRLADVHVLGRHYDWRVKHPLRPEHIVRLARMEQRIVNTVRFCGSKAALATTRRTVAPRGWIVEEAPSHAARFDGRSFRRLLAANAHNS